MTKSDFCFPKIKYISTQSVGLCTFFSNKVHKASICVLFSNKVHKVSFSVLFLNKVHKIPICVLFSNKVQTRQLDVPERAIMIKVHKMQVCVLMYFFSVTSNSQITKIIRYPGNICPVTYHIRYFFCFWRRTIS